ncbi:MAG: glycosyltransferase family 2 protein [Phycisphaerae bacterium]|nr:glycosyltransferase family 2 protein [Gemmatimonadaceae bacterium]
MKLSIIVVNWNVRELLRACLHSVRTEMRMTSSEYEVIVVDNASADESVPMLREEFPWVRLQVNAANVGFGAANNQALPLCAGTVILLLNPDTIVTDHALDRMYDRMMAEPAIGIVGSRLLNSDLTLQRWTGGASPTVWRTTVHTLFLDRFLPQALLGDPLYIPEGANTCRDVTWISGACLAIRRSAIRDYIFDKQFFMYGEDLELCHRLGDAGWRVVYDPSAVVVHHHGKSTMQSEDAMLAGLRGPRMFYAQRHGAAGLPMWDAIVSLGFLLRASMWGAAAMTGRSGARERSTTCWAFFRASLNVIGRRTE